MFPDAPKNRLSVDWSLFKETSGQGCFRLVLSPFYAKLFSIIEPGLVNKSTYGWQTTGSGKNEKLELSNLWESESGKIRHFIGIFESAIVLGRNPKVLTEFNNELDFCVAYSMNGIPSPKDEPFQRTEMGELVYQIKNKGRNKLVSKVVELLAPLTGQLLKCDCDWSLAHIPSGKADSNVLPRLVMDGLIKSPLVVRHLYDDCQVVEARITSGTPLHAKDLSVKGKQELWRWREDSGKLVLANNVFNRSICIIDDLYQSGSTMWSFARFLKRHGARTVIGIACVKTLRDSDNR